MKSLNTLLAENIPCNVTTINVTSFTALFKMYFSQILRALVKFNINRFVDFNCLTLPQKRRGGLWLEGIQLWPEMDIEINFLPIRLCFINVYTYPNPKPTPYKNEKNCNYCCTVWEKILCFNVRMPSSVIRIPSRLYRRRERRGVKCRKVSYKTWRFSSGVLLSFNPPASECSWGRLA